MSKDLDQMHYSNHKENYSMNFSKADRKKKTQRKKLSNLTKYFTKTNESMSSARGSNFDSFVKEHNISDRDLVVSSRAAQQVPNIPIRNNDMQFNVATNRT